MANSANRHNKLFYSRPHRLPLAEKIAIASLVIAVLAILVGIATPEIRCQVRLQSESCPESIASKA